MAQPDINVVHQLVFEAPLRPDHFFARVGIIGRRHGACDRAGSALVALLEIRTTHLLQLLDELQIRLNLNCFGYLTG